MTLSDKVLLLIFSLCPAAMVGATPFFLNPKEYTLNCSMIPTLPTITFNIGGVAFPLAGADYVINAGEGICLFAMMGCVLTY